MTITANSNFIVSLFSIVTAVAMSFTMIGATVV